jgi:hypothetical protein
MYVHLKKAKLNFTEQNQANVQCRTKGTRTLSVLLFGFK